MLYLDGKPSAPPVPGILIIEAGAKGLRRDGHTRTTDDLERLVSSMVASGQLRFKRYTINSVVDLEYGMALARGEFAAYDAIVIVGHGSADGHLEAAPGRLLPWDAVARAIAPLNPKALLAISCFGGAARPTGALFSAIPSLQAISGSPAPLTSRDACLAMVELVLRVVGVNITPELSGCLLLCNMILTGSVVWTRTRDEFERSSPAELVALDVAGLIFTALLKDALSDHLRTPPRRRERHAKLSGIRRRRLPSYAASAVL